MGSGFQRIKGIETGRYVAMNSGGIVYSTVSKRVQLITDYVIRHIRSRFFGKKIEWDYQKTLSFKKKKFILIKSLSEQDFPPISHEGRGKGTFSRNS